MNAKVSFHGDFFHDCGELKLLREVTLTAADLGSYFNFTQLASIAKFKIEPKCAAFKFSVRSCFNHVWYRTGQFYSNVFVRSDFVR